MAKAPKAPKADPKTKADRPGERKIGERVETIQQKLSPMEVEDVRAKVCDMLRELDKLEEERKSANASAKAKIQDLKSRIRIETGVAASSRRDVEITVEEWLSDKNEVRRIRADTGEVVGSRTARIDELQENLFEDEEDDDGDEDEDEGDDKPAGGDFGAPQ